MSTIVKFVATCPKCNCNLIPIDHPPDNQIYLHCQGCHEIYTIALIPYKTLITKNNCTITTS